MTEQLKKISRRDALKILGAAAGATALANLPDKWSTPELASGVLPVHAQTSVCEWSLTIEVISVAVGSIFRIQNSPFPPETNMVGNGGAGSAWYWDCQTGCLYLRLLTSPGADGVVRVTTRTSQFDLVFTAADNFRQLLVNLGTGDYSTNPNNPVGGCEWPM